MRIVTPRPPANGRHDAHHVPKNARSGRVEGIASDGRRIPRTEIAISHQNIAGHEQI